MIPIKPMWSLVLRDCRYVPVQWCGTGAVISLYNMHTQHTIVNSTLLYMQQRIGYSTKFT